MPCGAYTPSWIVLLGRGLTGTKRDSTRTRRMCVRGMCESRDAQTPAIAVRRRCGSGVRCGCYGEWELVTPMLRHADESLIGRFHARADTSTPHADFCSRGFVNPEVP